MSLWSSAGVLGIFLEPVDDVFIEQEGEFLPGRMVRHAPSGLGPFLISHLGDIRVVYLVLGHGLQGLEHGLLLFGQFNHLSPRGVFSPSCWPSVR